ncbi:uncharacterized protein [Rhodnius prolixus]|uniref:uncharacterized protein n=1 Tax=Rhodnius prolixus TaxID=13249 RepID=UPI003D18E1BF
MSSRRPSNESKSKVNVSTADSQKGTSHSEPKGDNKVKSIRERIFGSSSNKKEPSTSNDGRQNGEESKSRADSEIERGSNIRKSDKKAMKTADSEMETRSRELKSDSKARGIWESIFGSSTNKTNEKEGKSRVDSEIETSSSEPRGDNKVKSSRKSTFGSSSNKKEPSTSIDRRKSEKEGKGGVDSEIETGSIKPRGDNKVKSIRESIFGRGSNKKEPSTSIDRRKNEKEGKDRADSEIETGSIEPRGDNKVNSIRESIFGRGSNKKEPSTSIDRRKSEKEGKGMADSEIETGSIETRGDNKVKSIRESIFGSTSNQKEPSTSIDRRKSEKEGKGRADSEIETGSIKPRGDNKVKSIRESIFGSTSNQKEPSTSIDRRKTEKEGKGRADSEIETGSIKPRVDNKVNSIRESIFGRGSNKKESITSSDWPKSEKESKSRADSEIETGSIKPRVDNKVNSIRKSIFGKGSNKKESITSSDWPKSEKESKSRADSEVETRSSELKGDKKAKSVAEYQKISETESEKRSTVEFTYSSLQYKIHSVYAPQTDYGLKKREQVPKLEAFKLLVAFWIFGFCNNVGNIVMITAAEDMLLEITGSKLSRECSREDLSNETYYNRVCNEIGTGAIVVANIAPSIIVKIIAPFLPFMVHVRLIIAEIMTTLGFLSAALGYGSTQGHWMAIFGLIIISFARGLGESTLLAYTVFFSSKNVLSTWSSGTGAAGIVGAFLYSLLRKVNVGVKDTLLIMTIWPMVMATTFWVLVKHPYIKKSNIRFSTLEEATLEQIEEEIPTVEDVHTTTGKLKILKRIFLEYMAPYSLEFFFEYLICPTFCEILYYPDNAYASCKTDYRWFMSIFLLGVFIARSSMNCIVVNNLWLLALLQIINALVIFFEILYGYLYYILVCAACIFWVGLLAGASYVNTYRRISRELPPLQREFSMSMTTVSDAITITLAGLVAIPLHFYLCGTHNPYVERKRLRKLRLS